MSKMNQKEAVFSAINQVVGNDMGDNISKSISPAQRKEVTDILVQGFLDGAIVLQTQFPSEQALRTYCTGLLSNWLRKDDRLNGGVKYAPKNPGSRTSKPNDPQLKALSTLMSKVTDEKEKQEIQNYISKRQAEIAPPIVDDATLEALPPGLRTKYTGRTTHHGKRSA